ncbi:MAG: N-acetylmuramic acid 6-phosphate etherase [Trueperaceae bacterium]
MITESIHEAYRDLDAWPAAKILAAVNDANRRAIDAVAEALPDLDRAAIGIEERLRSGGRLFYVGAGTSGRVAVQDAAELPPTFGFERARVLLAGGQAAQDRAKEGAEDDVVAAAAVVDEAGVGRQDALVGIAASGVTPYTIAAVRRATERGAFTVGIANNPDTPLLTVGEVGILLATGPEVLAGSTRLAAGTAQKAALNALSTAVLVRLGGAYGNLMVGMRPVNAKLEKRAAAIVAEAAEVPLDAAAEVLARADDDIRTAIVMARTGVDADQAREAVRQHGGRVRDALREFEQGRARQN